MAKSTDAEYEQRVTTVYELMLRGARRADVIKAADKAAWNVETRQIDNYMRAARREIVKQAQAARDEQLGLARARYNMLFAGAMTLKDYKTALSVQKAICELEGLNPTPAIKVIRDYGLDEGQLAQLMQLLEDSKMSASEVFARMIDRLSQEKQPEKP